VVQAQEYLPALWSLALRMRRPSPVALEQAFAEGRILRTHVLRATWHFVAPADIRWMLALSAPRLRRLLGSYDGALGIDRALIRRCQSAMVAALEGGRCLTRQELRAAMEQRRLRPGEGQRLAHLMMHAELDGLICSGPLRGRHQTYALLEERLPAAPAIARDQALAELARRYFSSHGPAQLQDFVWWAGLAVADARLAIDQARDQLASIVVEGQTHWYAPRPSRGTRRTAHLLPTYDEYLVAYKDRTAAAHPRLGAGNPVLAATVIVDGRIVGDWRRVARQGKPRAELALRAPLRPGDRSLVDTARARYEAFAGDIR
jgi:hypothetical protein